MSTEKGNEKLQSLLYTDDLTQIFNRRYLSEKAPQYLTQADDKSQTIAFFMIDMDNFKGINDTHGHQAGDDALVHFSRILVEKTKPDGTAIRYAGDEFVLLVPGLDKHEARELGTEIQQKMKELPLKVGDEQLKLSCSAGVSLFPKDGKTWKTLFKKADEALYAAKQWGKGRVIPFPDAGKFMTPSKLDSILEAPPIVGRDDIVQFLNTHISEEGNPLVFPILFGNDGTGKTRLIKHVEEIARDKFAFTLLAKGYPYWQTETYGSIFAALGSLFEQDQRISDYVFSKLDEKYKLILKPNLYPWQAKVIKLKEEEKESDSTALFAALTQTFIILREIGDGAVLLDDADQIDPPSLQLLDSQFKQENSNKLHFVSTINSPDLTSGEEKLMLLLNSMPEAANNSEIKRFELKLLNLEQINQLTTKVFDGKTLPAESAEALMSNSAGNPLFIVETLSSLLQEGKIEAIGYEWDLSSVKPEDIPQNLNDLIKGRLMRLDKEAFNTLKLASILGEKINPQQLAEMTKLKVQQVLNILSKARRLLLIEETPNPDEFVFAHRMGRSVFYSLMSEEERSDYHKLAAEIEKKYAAGSLERVVGRLAYHYQNAGQMVVASKMFSAMKNHMEEVYIPEATRKGLQKRLLTESLAEESPLEAEDLAKATDVAAALKTSMQNLRLYPKENINVINAAKRLLGLLESFLKVKTEALSVSLTPETMLLNGQPVPAKSLDSQLRNSLYKTLNRYGLQGILFIRGVNLDELVRFLELFTKKPEEVASRWDELVEQLELSNILPDRKVFVAVGERKVLDGQEFIALDSSLEGNEVQAGTAPRIEKEHMEQLKSMLDQFAKEKDELLSAMKAADVGEQEFQRLLELLNQTSVAKLEKAVKVPEGAPPRASGIPTKKDRYADVLSDFQIVEEAEEHISLAFEDLNSQDTKTRAKAAAWLVKQEPKKLADAGLRAITSDMPLRARLLVAAVIKKAGKPTMDAFLEKINTGMSTVQLLKALKVADMFLESPKLIPVLREIILMGSDEVIPPAIEVLKQIPGRDVNSVLLDLFSQVNEKVKTDILILIAERKIHEALPTLLAVIKPKNIWEKEERISVQAQACRTLGLIGLPAATERLISVAKSTKLGVFVRAKPDSVRAAAIWALKKFPDNKKINKALDDLRNDKSPLVRKAASL